MGRAEPTRFPSPHAAMARGPHASAHQFADFLRDEMDGPWRGCENDRGTMSSQVAQEMRGWVVGQGERQCNIGLPTMCLQQFEESSRS